MSEYQYYEYRAIDKPLTAKEMASLRSLSTRALITPVSFSNYYTWGGFREDPDELMDQYFDVYVWVTNWRTATFKIRLPLKAIEKEMATALSSPYALDFKMTPSHWIVTWELTESEDSDGYVEDDGRGWMARLAPIREELIQGDYRSLYIGWLAQVSRNMLADEELEPMPMSGVGELTPAQQALAAFLELNQDLLSGAAIDNPPLQSSASLRHQREEWINSLSRNELGKFIDGILASRERETVRMLKIRFAAWQRCLVNGTISLRQRTVRELWENTEISKKNRLTREKAEQQQRETRKRREREQYLKSLSVNISFHWKKVGITLTRGSGAAYDQACRSVSDIHDAHLLNGTPKKFQMELRQFMANHMGRKAFIKRLVEAGIWPD